jgi:hypothetical protein
MTYVYRRNIYKPCHQGNYCPGQFDLTTPQVLSGLGAILGWGFFFMSRTSAVSSRRLMPVPFCNLMITRRHGNSYTCRTVKVVLVTDESQSVRKVDYLVRRRCSTLLEFAWWLNHVQSRCAMCCSGRAEQRLLEMPQMPRNAPLQVIVCPDVIGALDVFPGSCTSLTRAHNGSSTTTRSDTRYLHNYGFHR